MNRLRWLFAFSALGLWGLCLVGLGWGCGLIADKDLIKVAKINDKYIRRGDLFKILREMPNEERPIIQNRGDLLRVLQGYVDDRIKEELAQQLESEGKIKVARELAERLFRQQHPELWVDIANPEEYGISQEELEALKFEREDRIDQLREKLLAEAAVRWLVVMLSIRLRKDELRNFETIEFTALCFPAAQANSEVEAASVMKRLDAGEQFEDLVEEYAAKDTSLVIHSAIENNPALLRFRTFWMSASGCKKGDIIGVIFLPTSDVMAIQAEGQPVVRRLPDSHLVLKVLEHTPETIKTIKQAAPELALGILRAKMMELLREENGVEIYEGKLPDPAFVGESL